jgi:hypothetical protein
MLGRTGRNGLIHFRDRYRPPAGLDDAAQRGWGQLGQKNHGAVGVDKKFDSIATESANE